MQKKTPELLKKYIDYFIAYSKKTALELCFESTSKQCSGKIIRSHSIQNSFILDQLEVNNHLSIIEYNGGNEVAFKPISRNEASTFTGFCNYHDNQLFQLIDFQEKNIISTMSQKQIVLFHYRTVCLEYWSKLNMKKALFFLKNTISRKNKRSLVKIFPFLASEKSIDWEFPNINELESHLTALSAGIKDVKPYYDSTKDQIKKNKIRTIKGAHFKIDSPAKFAISSFTTPTCDFKGNMINDLSEEVVHYIGLNIFPYKNETHVILTWHEGSNYTELKNQILNLTGNDQKIQLSKFILANCENIVFSPKLTDTFDQTQKERIKKIFVETTPDNASFKLDDFEDVNLF